MNRSKVLRSSALSTPAVGPSPTRRGSSPFVCPRERRPCVSPILVMAPRRSPSWQVRSFASSSRARRRRLTHWSYRPTVSSASPPSRALPPASRPQTWQMPRWSLSIRRSRVRSRVSASLHRRVTLGQLVRCRSVVSGVSMGLPSLSTSSTGCLSRRGTMVSAAIHPISLPPSIQRTSSRSRCSRMLLPLRSTAHVLLMVSCSSRPSAVSRVRRASTSRRIPASRVSLPIPSS